MNRAIRHLTGLESKIKAEGLEAHRIALFHREFASQGLSYNVSSVSANVVQDFFL